MTDDRRQVIDVASDMSLGRFPGRGSGINDLLPYEGDVDATHPANFDYVIPRNFQRLVSAKLSFRIRAYRNYATTTNATIHSHALSSGTGAIAQTAGFDAGGKLTSPAVPNVVSVGGEYTVGAMTSGSPPGPIITAGHTHDQVNGITESAAPVNPGLTVAFDSTDRTTVLGGPWNTDMVEIDVTQYLPVSVSAWHTMTLQPNQVAHITGFLRLSYYVDARLSQ